MVTMNGILNIGGRGIAAAQAGLNITGNNLANANTEGYSRQRTVQNSITPVLLPQGAFGQGVEVVSVERIRDMFLEGQIRDVQSDKSYQNELNKVFQRIESALNDPLTSVSASEEDAGIGGINNLLSNFFSALNDLTLSPEAPERRKAVIDSATALAETFNFSSQELTQIQDDINSNVRLLVQEINNKGERIVSLNLRIAVQEVGGQDANDLRDQRDTLLKELAELVPINTTESPNGMVNVTIEGRRLVDNANMTPVTLEVSETSDNIEQYNIRMGENGLYAMDDEIRKGELGAMLDARDRIVPFFQDEIDSLAHSVAYEVNKIHSGSSGLEGQESYESEKLFTSAQRRSDTTKTLEQIFTIPANNDDLTTSQKPFPVQDGTFSVRVGDEDNNTLDVFDVDINTDDTIFDVVKRIDRSDGIVKKAQSALNFDPVFVKQVKGNLGFETGEAGQAMSTLASTAATPLAENPGAAQTFDILIRDEAGNLVDSDTTTPAIDPFTVTFDGNMTMEQMVSQIQLAGKGLVRANLVASDIDPTRTVLQMTAIPDGYTFSVQNDTSGTIKAWELPITDPNEPLIGGSTTTATGSFSGLSSDSIFGAGSPAFSPAFPGPPPSVIEEGSFDLVVIDNNNVPTVTTITLTAGGVESLDDIAAQIEAADANLTVDITADNQFKVTSDNKRSFFFQDDTTGVVKALGFDEINGFGEVGSNNFVDGSFEIVVANKQGRVSHTFEVPIVADPSTIGGVVSLNDIVDAINQSAGSVGAPVRASIVSDPSDSTKNVLQVESIGEFEYTFRSDDSFVLSALGFTDGPVLRGTGDPPILGAETVTGNGSDIGAIVRAEFTDSGLISISTSDREQITFAGDSSNFLAAAGINSFFRGNDATTIQVDSRLQEDVNLLAVSSDGSPGNNTGALALAELEDQPVIGGRTLSEYYRSTIADLGLESSRSERFLTTNDSILRELERSQEENSGVSLDEESINLIRYQQAFQASARIITTIDQLLDVIINQIGG